MALWFLHEKRRSDEPGRLFLMPAAAALVLLTPLTAAPVIVIGVITAALLAVRIAFRV